MVTASASVAHSGQEAIRPPVATTEEVASQGIRSTRDITRLGSSMLNDLVKGTLNSKVANPMCRTVGFMCRTIEMEQRHNDGRPIDVS